MAKKWKSIIQNDKFCYFTGETYELHEHHVFGGANRKISDKYGLVVYLTPAMHNMSAEGVHLNKERDRQLKEEAQTAAMEHYGWTIADFVRIFGKNYLNVEW